MCCGIREGSTAAVDKVNLDSILADSHISNNSGERLNSCRAADVVPLLLAPALLSAAHCFFPFFFYEEKLKLSQRNTLNILSSPRVDIK